MQIPSTSTYSKNKSLTFILFLLSIILTILVMIYRKPEAFTKAQFWAEDGIVFFQQCYQTGISSLLTPYAGYLHLIPRVIALLTFHTVSFEHTPLAYNIISLFLCLGLVSFIWYRTKFDPYTKFFMILTLSLVPVGSEMVLNITNIQWYVSLFIPLYFLTGYSKKFVLFDALVLFLVALTGPFSVIFLPVVCVIVWYRSRTYGQWKDERWIFFVYLLATTIQLLTIALSTREHTGWSIVEKLAHSPRLVYLQLANPLGIAKLYIGQLHKGIFIILLLAQCGWLYLCWRKFTRERNAFPLFLMVAAIFAVAANIHTLGPATFPYLNPINNGMRYFFGPCILFVWSVLAYCATPAETQEKHAAPRYMPRTIKRNIAFLLLFAYYTAVMMLTIPTFNLADYNWPEQAKKLENFQKGHLEIPINPNPVKMSFDK